jgi:primosomal protein N''
MTDQEIEALARAMMRETIDRSGWYPLLQGKFRQERIDQDVERYWHLMIQDARRRLEQGRAGTLGGSK